MRTLLRVLGRTALVLLIVGIILATIVTTFVVWNVRRSFPQVDGTIDVPGLSASVEVIRDARGVPQIYADTEDDLFFAQGYVHAQDRFWEMDVRRHITAGRLSEMFGTSQVDTDAFLRTLGWRRVAEQELALLSPTSRRILDAYARGVNAWLTGRSGSAVSLEYGVLALNNPSYVIEPWTPADSVAWLKALAWDLRGNMDDEITRTLTAKLVGVDRTLQLYPPYPYERNAPIITAGGVVDGAFDPAARPGAASTLPSALRQPDASRALLDARTALGRLDGVLGPGSDGIGSNSWVVSGSLTATGKPLLANDPHLAPQMPSLWYQAGLHCRTVSASCRYGVAGWTMSGLPGVFIGHNGRIAWGFTNLGPDVSDLVLEKVSGDSAEYDGQQVPLTTRQEVIRVAGGDPVTITVRSTRHGPLISDRAETYRRVAGAAVLPAPGQDAAEGASGAYAVALRWTALTPTPIFDAFDVLNTANDWDDFRAAARLLTVPAQNLVYADVDGNIGYQAPGAIPIRRGYDGRWPVPGWSSRFDWDGYIPFEQLPYAYNPPEGFITTANQAVVRYPGYPHDLTPDPSYGARSQRITDLIREATGDGNRMTVEAMQRIQTDNRNDLASFLAPKLTALADTPETREAVAAFDGWDFQQDAASSPAAYFNAVFRDLMRRMFDSKFAGDEAILSNRSDRFWEVIRTLWDTPDDPWWTDGVDPANTSRDATVRAAMKGALEDLAPRIGREPRTWKWGQLHQLELRNQTLGDSGIAPIEWLFNRGPYEVGGGGSIVNATGWTPSEGYEVNWVPSMRQVVDLADLDRSTWVNLTGTSGHAYHRWYRDQTEAWVAGRQYPWPFTRAAVDAASRHRLVLRPA